VGGTQFIIIAGTELVPYTVDFATIGGPIRQKSQSDSSANPSVSVSTKKVRVNQSMLIRVFFVLNFVFWSFKFVSPVLRRSSTSEDGDLEFRISDLPRYPSTPKVKKCKKMVQKVYILVHFRSKRAHF
jgi:hypothetical protein